MPTRIFQLGLDLRDCRVDAADLGIHGELGTQLSRFGHVELRQRRLVLILTVLSLEFCVGTFRCKLLNVRVAFRIERDLRGQPGDIGRRLLVIRFQYLGLLFGSGQRRA